MRDFCGGKAHLTQYNTFQLLSDSVMANTAMQLTLLFENSMQHTFPLTYAIQYQVPFQKVLCFCAGRAAEGEEGGTLSLERSHQPLTALCMKQFFLAVFVQALPWA